MYLKRLEIIGFKSFAKKTILEFLKTGEASATAIVGPNGSGKSNIVDAIRWGLGEQGLKTLRGKKSDDVIFAGSKGAPSLSLAEVSLYFDKENQELASMPYQEFTITRRIFRNGQSSYLINNQAVRLQDILILLAEANFGQKSYSIISQGMIDWILISSPQEKKIFFDEATGIRSFQIKRDEALKKIERAKTNFREGEITLEELTPRMRLLSRQVKKLDRLKIIKEELQKLQIDYYGNLWQTINDKLKKINLNYQVIDNKKSKKISEIRILEDKIYSFAQESISASFKKLQKDWQNLLRIKSELSEKKILLSTKISPKELPKISKNEILNTLVKFQDEIKKIITFNNLEQVKIDLEKLNKEINHLLSLLKGERIAPEEKNDLGIEEINQKLEKINLEISSLENEMEKFSLKEDEKRKEMVHWQEELREKQSELNSLDDELNLLKTELTRQETRKEILSDEIKKEIGFEILSYRNFINEIPTAPKQSLVLDSDRRKNPIRPSTEPCSGAAQGEIVPSPAPEQVRCGTGSARPIWKNWQKLDNPEELLPKINRLRRDLELIGGIDPLISKEYKECSERFKFLSEQINDLKETINSLNKIISQLDKKISQGFEKGFLKINQEFDKFFKIFFGGGKAKLVLKITETPSQEFETEIADSIEENKTQIRSSPNGVNGSAHSDQRSEMSRKAYGIEISVSPPRKRIKNLESLSGGEKALTALALIAAIISSSVPPCVILDEVDAALDEKNSERFAKILKDLSKKIQFIIITHNRETMKIADLLYGVTMDDKGISHLYSLKLEK